jgi:3-hydroxy-9,10-secoandrosta-1,3,5(10)-triene-9,17-dione monooxygenase
MDRETLVERAHKLVPVLRERTARCDELGRLPDETREDLRETGIARILQPARYGGAQAHFSGMIEILTAIGSGCGSTAWCLAQYIGHNFMVAQWPERAQETIWGQDPKSLVAGILIPHLGRAEKVRGGYRLSGRWPFVSGVDACDWTILSGLVERGDRDPEERYFLVPKSDYEILDTWDAIGLRGSGSHDIRADDLFIPSHMTLPIRHLKGGESPGRKLHRADLYRSPSYMTFGLLIVSASVGMAEGLVRDYTEHAKTRVALMSGQAHIDQPTQHVRLSKAVMSVEAAQAILHRNCDEIMAILASDRLPTNEERTKFRAAGAMAGSLAFDAAQLIWDAEGGRGVYMKNPVARAYRDLCTATRHMTHSWDLNGGLHGRVRLGLPLDNPSL